MFKTIPTSRLITLLILPPKVFYATIVEMKIKTKTEINDMSRSDLERFLTTSLQEAQDEIDRRIPVPA
jgi:hypothetical protein